MRSVTPVLFSLKTWLAAFLFALVGYAIGPLYAQDMPVFPPGSHVGMVPPEGFVVSPDFKGFMDREVSASIVMNEMPREVFTELVAGFTKERLAERGMELLGPCGNVTTTVESVCHRISIKVADLTVQRWLLIAQFSDNTAMVVVNLPDFVLANGIHSASAIEDSLSSIAYTANLATSPLEALPFAIEEGELLPFQRAIGGSGALYVGQATSDALQPLWIVTASLDTRPQARQSEFSRRAFERIDTLADTQVAGEQTITVGALAGHLLEGTGSDNETGEAMYVFQAILVDENDKYFRLVGIVPTAQKDAYRPEFLRLTQTLTTR